MSENKSKIEMWFELGSEHYEEGEFEEAILLFTKAAKEGSAEAQRMLGMMHESGEGVEWDPEKALYWYKKSAEQGNDDAMCAIASLYLDGNTVIDVNANLAIEWYEKAAAHAKDGDDFARRKIEELTIKEEEKFDEAKLADKHYNRNEYDKAIPLYRRSAENSNVHSQYQLGFIYSRGFDGNEDQAEAMKWLEKVARTDNEYTEAAVSELCIVYGALADEHYARKEYEEAARYYHKVAENEEEWDSYYSLGFMYRHGQGVEKNLKLAYEWLEKAVENEFHESAAKEFESLKKEIAEKKAAEKQAQDKQAQIANAVIIANDYMHGKNGKPQDYKQAAHWIKIAAEAGDTGSMTMLGAMLWNGQGVSKDLKSAVYWLEKAAQNGNSNAVEALVDVYADLGAELFERKEYSEALKYCQEAAEKNRYNAMLALGFMYADGKGTPKNHELAEKWLNEVIYECPDRELSELAMKTWVAMKKGSL